MSLKVVELNDSAVTVSDENGLLLQSPGFALVYDTGLEVGSAAEQQARLKPTNSFNKFWHQLSVEPLGMPLGNIRHFADLAYAHLLHIAEEADIEGDVIFAVPGNFSSQQIAILLGLAKQTPLTPVGVVDAALAKVVGMARAANLIFIDIQLHQTLLTRFAVVDDELERHSVVQLQDSGLQQFWDQIMQLATSSFIQQSRFNPQHNAESEQQLYNSLPGWFRQQGDHTGDLEMEIKTAQAVYQAKMPWEVVQKRLAQFYGRIEQKIQTLSPGFEDQVVVATALSQLPGFNLEQFATLPQSVAPEEAGKNCIDLQDRISSSDEGFHFVTRLPLIGVTETVHPATRKVSSTATAAPTHALFESQALPLGKITINNGENQERVVNGDGRVIHMALNGFPSYLGQLEKEGSQVFIICGETGALINGEKVTGRKELVLGDRIQFREDSKHIELIQVSDGIA